MSLHVKSTDRGLLKQVDEGGRVVAVFATLNTIDKDGDVTMPGAFGEQEVVMVPAHDWRSIPLGKGRITEQGEQAVADLMMNRDTEAGRDWHSALRFDLDNGTPLQEWSYGFHVLKSSQGQHEGQDVTFLESLDVHEVSPVLLGAGEGTRTVEVKHRSGEAGGGRAVPEHEAKTAGGAWDAPANERRVLAGKDAGYYDQVYAWHAPAGGDGGKGAWRFIHHHVAGDGSPGAASVRACITGIAVLNGARGGTTIPDADRASVHRHLAKHLRDAGEDVPELRSYDECASRLADQIMFAAWDAETALERAKEARAARKDDGRDLSPDRIADLGSLKDTLAELHRVAEAIQAELGKGDDPAALDSLFTEFALLESRLQGGAPQ